MTPHRDVRLLLTVALSISTALILLAPVEFALGWITVDRGVGMLFDGVTVAVGGLMAGVVWMLWSRLNWRRRDERMRDYLMYVTRTSRTGSLGGTPATPAEGGASPVDAAGVAPAALPGESSTVADLDSYRERR